MKGYNKQVADDLAKDFEDLTGIELNSNSRKTEIMITRTLFYKILKEFNFMTDEMISDWFSTRGVNKGRSSITHAVKKVGLYYKSYASFRNTYNVYFNDKAEEFLTIEQAQKKRLNDSKQNIRTNTLKKDKDALELLIDTIPEDRREEVREIVNLRVKSWSWKTKDECQIILGETSIEGYCF
jgi:hypothetical protein